MKARAQHIAIMVLMVASVAIAQYRDFMSVKPQKRATVLNGTNQVWSITSPTLLSFDSSTNFTIALWIKRTATGSGNERIINKRNTTGYEIRFLNASSKIDAFMQGSTTANPVTTSTLALNRWYLIVLTVNRSGNAQLYLNGAADGSAVSVTGLKNIDVVFPFRIGDSGAGDYYKGQIGGVQIISGYVLTAQEIANMYTKKAFSVSYGGGRIAAWYEWKSSGLDRSGNGNHITSANSPAIIPVRY